MGGWHSLGLLSLAPVVLLSPLPCMLPIGVGASVACAFAPAFRSFALRPIAALPTPDAAATERLLLVHRATQYAESGCAALVVAYAAVATFGGAPRALTSAYLGIVLAWAIVAAGGLIAQLRLGDGLARQLVDPTLLPAAGAARATRGLLGVMVAAALGGACVAASTALGPGGWLGGIGATLLVLASFGLAACALFARAHAELVAECVFESPILRERQEVDPMHAPREAVVPRPPPPPEADEPPIPLA